MRKYILIYVICLAPLTAVNGNTVSVAELRNNCFSKSAIYAVPACEQLITTTDADDKIHYRLATLYQKQNQLEKAKLTLERALSMFDAKGDSRTVAKTAQIKSNVEEEIWLQGNSRQVDEDAEHRVKCIKFSKILPKLALGSCDHYLAVYPDDQEVAQYKDIAQDSLAKKSSAKSDTTDNPQPTQNVNQPVNVVSRTLQIPSEEPSLASAKDDNTNIIDSGVSTPNIAGKHATAEPDAKLSAKTQSSASSKPAITQQPMETKQATASQPAQLAATAVPENQITIDPQVIADIKNELSGLYALLEQQKQSQVAVESSLAYNEPGNRYALIIGNAAYSPAIGRLKNPVNDAMDISAELKKLDFEVQLVTDGNLQKMEESVEILAQKIHEDDTVLFYYAGHGVALDGENYLLPTKMGIKDSVDVRYKSLNLSYVLDKLDRGSNGVTVVVIDACRNNPFPASRGAASAGLVQSSGPVGTIIAYSTAPGDVALDGTGRNGLYTKHLLLEISKPGVKLEDVFKKVRVGVAEDTQGAQVPWENSSLKGDFYFSYN